MLNGGGRVSGPIWCVQQLIDKRDLYEMVEEFELLFSSAWMSRILLSWKIVTINKMLQWEVEQMWVELLKVEMANPS